MDTHLATHPDIDPGMAGMSARLPDEIDEASPIISESEAGERPPSPALTVIRRRGPLLAGVALGALAIAGGAFLVSPYNKVYPVPRLQTAVHGAAENAAHVAQDALRPILAPSASLAKVAVPPTPPATREAYTPTPHEREVAELLSLHPGSTDLTHPTHEPGSRSEGHRAATPVVHATAMATAADPAAPAGYMPREPGSSASPTSSVKEPAAPAGALPKDPTALIIASLPQEPGAAPATPVAPQAASPQAPTPLPQSAGNAAPNMAAPAPPVPPAQPDTLTVATTLRASPMTSPEQVQVLSLVTEIAAMVKDLRRQQAQLRSDLGKSSTDVTTHLTDFERRLALAEARSAVTAADDTAGHAPANATLAPPADPVPAPLKAISLLTRPVAVVPAPVQAGAPKIYRVQAASPGLALLAQVDRGGGDGAQIQVVVGDTVPDYGRVKSIAQKGTAWVVTTEHGAIQ